MDDALTLAGQKFQSRLILGTARYPNHDILMKALAAGGAELVTVAIRTGSLAPATAVLSRTPSQPSSMATATSEAVPTPASTIRGTLMASRIREML